jgi:hypothetical protein
MAHLKEILTKTTGRREALEALKKQDQVAYEEVLSLLGESSSWKSEGHSVFTEDLLFREEALTEPLKGALTSVMGHLNGAYSLSSF